MEEKELTMMILGILFGVGTYFVGYYKGKCDTWSPAYDQGERSGWAQAIRRQAKFKEVM